MLYTRFEQDLVIQESGLLDVLTYQVISEVHDRYNEDTRHYHDFDHAVAVLSWGNVAIRELGEGALYPYTPFQLRLAILFHDVVYGKEGSPHNEQESVKLMKKLLANQVSVEDLDKAGALIMMTARHGEELHDLPLAEALILDCDIANLGESRWEVFKWNNENVVKELVQVYSAEQVAVGRRKFLEGMLSKKTIYHSRYFRSTLEINARDNLRRAVGEL